MLYSNVIILGVAESHLTVFRSGVVYPVFAGGVMVLVVPNVFVTVVKPRSVLFTDL